MSNKNWTHEVIDEIVWLGFDREGSSTNTINDEVLNELESIIDSFEGKGLVIYSCKEKGFIAGADIEEFKDFETADDARNFLQKGHDVFNKLENLSVPTVAMINGFCLGGGTELSLACQYRVAEDGDKTKIGLPEVKLGIMPGWGGTVRLPRLVGALKAMDIILTGRMISGKAAYRMGVVDAAVPERQLKNAATHFIVNNPGKRQATFLENLTNNILFRPLLALVFNNKLKQKIQKKHYPAPFAVISNWLKNGVNSDNAFSAEVDTVCELFSTDTAKNLVRVFFLQNRMKALAKNSDFIIRHIHVIGAGVMGGDIAAWCALKGFQVTLQDREPKFIAPAIKRAHKLFKKKLKKPRLIQHAMDRLAPDVNGFGVKKADVIIEAIYENLEAKQEIFKSLEKNAKATAVLASNTSSIPLDEINAVMKNPERLVGIHFFNPVALMQLVEIVKGDKTTEDTTNNAMAFVKAIGKLPLPVKSHPGFLVNRVLMPYLLEGVNMLEEGVPAQDIDQAAVDFGMPLGPIELADTVGLDVCKAVADTLMSHFGGEVPAIIAEMVAQGKLGRKSGEGFYKYKRGKPVKPRSSSTANQLNGHSSRLINTMLIEAKTCLEEGVVDDADLLDAGMIFGTGFAPFRGGPINYAKAEDLR